MRMHRSAVVALFAAAAAAVAAAQAPATSPAKPAAPQAQAAHPSILSANDLQWGPAPDAFNAGAQLAVLDGDPSKPGPFAIRVKFPDGFKVMPHRHPTDENVTVISGTLMAGMGEKWDDAAMKAFSAGGFVRMRSKSPHYVAARGETILQIHAMGPFVLTYVDANDDPRKKK